MDGPLFARLYIGIRNNHHRILRVKQAQRSSGWPDHAKSTFYKSSLFNWAISSFNLATLSLLECTEMGVAWLMIILIRFSSLYVSHLVRDRNSNKLNFAECNFARKSSGFSSKSARRSLAFSPTTFSAVSSNSVTHWNGKRNKVKKGIQRKFFRTVSWTADE